MGLLSYEFGDRRRRDVVRFSWAAAAAVLLGFPLTRYVLDGPVALVVSQVLYVGSAIAASAWLGTAASRARSGSRGRIVWSLLAVAVGLIAVSEFAYSWTLIVHGSAGMVNNALVDLVNVLAALAFIAMLAVGISVDRMGRLAASRFIIDLLAVSALCFTVLYRLSVAQVVVAGPPMAAYDAIRYAVYASIGFLIIVGDVVLFCSFPARRFRPWDRMLGIGIAVFGVGVTFWPAWSLATLGHDVPPWAQAGVIMLYLVGYLIMAMAALQRALAVDVPWLEWTRPQRDPAWVGLSIMSAVFLSVIVLAFWTAQAPAGSIEASIYVSMLSTAAVSAVLRTLIATIEAGRMKATALADDATGLGNTRAFRQRVAELIGTSRRFGEPFAVAIVDFDGLAGDTTSQQGRDALLAASARVCTTRMPNATVFRLADDRLGVAASRVSDDAARSFAASVVDAFEAALDGAPATVSAGVVCCTRGEADFDELVGHAAEACRWVRRHSGARSVVYDERLSAVLAVDERLTPVPEGTGMAIARALAAAADVRDPASHHHSRNVAALAVLLATELGFDASHIDRIRIAAMLHDAGKLASPIVPTGGRLAAARRRRTEHEHPALGQRLLESLQMDDVPQWVRSHHERWDGQGHPDGLLGEQIPVEARIIALADAYDAMTAANRHGGPMSKGAALQEIDLGIGTRFDPELAETFIRLVGQTSALGWADDWPAA